MRLNAGKINLAYRMDKIVLDRICVNNNVVEYYYSVSDGLSKYFKTDRMFLEYEEDMDNVPTSILTIPFVNCMAGLSWLSNSVIFVDEIDATFYSSFKSLKTAYNELHRYAGLKGMLVPSRIINNEISQSQDGILLFGGGVDCHTSFLRNRDNIAYILNIYGWLNDAADNSTIDYSDKQHTCEYADRMNVKAMHTRSNFASQFNMSMIDSILCKAVHTTYWYGFLHSMAFLAIAAPLAWNHNVTTLYIASSFTKNKVGISCASYITTDSEFRFAMNGHTIHDGFELSRQDKVAYLVNYQRQSNAPYPLQACSFNDHNCCECEKCFRTTVELVAENANPRDFGFNIDGSMRDHWKRIIDRDVALWGPHKESYYYGLSADRMRENYDIIEDKEFVDWFLACNFTKMKKDALPKYYMKNFFQIIRRKTRTK